MNNLKQRRYRNTIKFISKYISVREKILDLGTPNELSKLLASKGFQISNTKGEDLDLNPDELRKYEVDVMSAFEILEHLVSPFNVLREIRAEKLIATVPLRLWFATAYRNPKDPWDRHFHEFEDWQFDWLLEKAGWTIKAREKWTNPTYEIGFRPILRFFTPRYYAVYAERK
jgi:hypothetical protein